VLRTNIIFAWTILVLSIGPAWADKPGWVKVDGLYVREGPGTDHDRIGKLSKGDNVVVTAFTDDRWCKALLPDGKVGWVKEEYLEFSGEAGRRMAKQEGKAAMCIPAWSTSSSARMRGGPSLSSKVIGHLTKGEKVFVTDVDDSWRKVKTDSGTGWVHSGLLEFDLQAGRRLAGQGGGTASSGAAWINTEVVNVRKGPSQGYSKVGQLTKGAKVQVIETKSDWVKCSGQGCTGWIRSDLLETEASRGRKLAADTGAPGRDKAYCVGNRVHLREGPDRGRESLDKLLEGETLWIQDEKSGWCKVTTEEGKTGWIAGWYVRRHGAQTTVTQPPTLSPLTAPGADFPSPSVEPEEGRLEPFTAWIAEDGTRVRAGPGLDQPVKLALDKHAKVRVTDCEKHWCKVTTESGEVGWAAGWVLDFQPPGRPEAYKVINGKRQEVKTGWVNSPVVHVRAGQGTDAKALGTVNLGDEVIIIGRSGEWLNVVMGDGTTGWVRNDLIQARAERLTNGGGDASGVGARIVREAMRHLGKPYRRGAEGPNTFDCSGFTQYVLGKFGVRLRRTCDGVFRQGRPVARDELVPGDVVVFRNTYKRGISHVGIYIGNNNFIHASNSRSGVKISSLDSGYYAPKWVGARRMH